LIKGGGIGVSFLPVTGLILPSGVSRDGATALLLPFLFFFFFEDFEGASCDMSSFVVGGERRAVPRAGAEDDGTDLGSWLWVSFLTGCELAIGVLSDVVFRDFEGSSCEVEGLCDGGGMGGAPFTGTDGGGIGVTLGVLAELAGGWEEGGMLSPVFGFFALLVLNLTAFGV
jgi:hypothetical protein